MHNSIVHSVIEENFEESLYHACTNGDIERVKELLESYPGYVNSIPEYLSEEQSPFRMAICLEDKEQQNAIIQLLLPHTYFYPNSMILTEVILYSDVDLKPIFRRLFLTHPDLINIEESCYESSLIERNLLSADSICASTFAIGHAIRRSGIMHQLTDFVRARPRYNSHVVKIVSPRNPAWDAKAPEVFKIMKEVHRELKTAAICALACFVKDGYAEISNKNPDIARYLKIISVLPLDLKLVLSNRTVGRIEDTIHEKCILNPVIQIEGKKLQDQFSFFATTSTSMESHQSDIKGKKQEKNGEGKKFSMENQQSNIQTNGCAVM